MGFFGEQKLLAEQLRKHLSNDPASLEKKQFQTQTTTLVDQLASLEDILGICRPDEHKFRTLVDVHTNIKSTLLATSQAYASTSSISTVFDNGNHRPTLLDRLAVENLKLSVLLGSLQIKRLASRPQCSTAFALERSIKINKYIDSELAVIKGETPQVGSYIEKWVRLHDETYLGKLPKPALKWTIPQHLHAAAQHLCAATQREPVCDSYTRWMHCMLCMTHIRDFRIINPSLGPADSRTTLNDLELSLERYCTELEIELHNVVTNENLSMKILTPSELQVVISNQSFIGFTGRDIAPKDDRPPSQSTASDEATDPRILMEAYLNEPYKSFILRKCDDGCIRMEPKHKRHQEAFASLSESDLRLYNLSLQYAIQIDKSKSWEIILSNSRLSSQYIISFGRSWSAYDFQHKLTGFRVSKDYGPSVQISIHQRSSRITRLLFGRLQIWDKRSQNNTTTTKEDRIFERSQTALSSMSMSSTKSSTFQSISQYLKSETIGSPSHKTHGQQSDNILVVEPSPPFIVLLVVSSNDTAITSGEIFALGFNQKANFDHDLCKCRNPETCHRSIVKSTKRYNINLKHGGSAIEKESFAWIDIYFNDYQNRTSHELRQEFEINLLALRSIYLEDLEEFNETATMGLKGGLETSAIQRSSLA